MQLLHYKLITDDDVKFWHEERGYFCRIASRAMVEQFITENSWTLGLTTLLEITGIDKEEFMTMVEKMESENMKIAYKDLPTIRAMFNLTNPEDDFVNERSPTIIH